MPLLTQPRECIARFDLGLQTKNERRIPIKFRPKIRVEPFAFQKFAEVDEKLFPSLLCRAPNQFFVAFEIASAIEVVGDEMGQITTRWINQ